MVVLSKKETNRVYGTKERKVGMRGEGDAAIGGIVYMQP